MNFLPARIHGEVNGEIDVEVNGLGRCHISARQAPGAVTGGDASIGFRPETLTILYEGQAASDRETPGSIEEVVYYGDMTYYDVKLDGVADPVRISMRNVFGREVLERGAKTRVAWSAGALVLFR